MDPQMIERMFLVHVQRPSEPTDGEPGTLKTVVTIRSQDGFAVGRLDYAAIIVNAVATAKLQLHPDDYAALLKDLALTLQDYRGQLSVRFP